MSKKSMTIRVPVTVIADKAYKPGEPVKLPEEEAKRLIALHGELPEPETASEEPKVKKPSGKALAKAIQEAIEKLDPENDDHFTRAGKPNVSEIEKILGYDIKAEERDAVWGEMSKQAVPAGQNAAG